MDPLLVTFGIVVLATAWISAVVYSKRTFPFLVCGVCKGTNKIFEPWILSWACLRFKKRAFRHCTACDGGKYERRGTG